MFRLVLLPLFLLCGICAAAQDLNYYLPAGIDYDRRIPRPANVLYHEVGEWHVTHDRLTAYMKAVADAAPARIRLHTMGLTHEHRPQQLLIITSPKNHARLEAIRQAHLALSDPSRSASLSVDTMPAVVWIGHSIHGNEPSGSNAALLTAYHLAAAQGADIEKLLEDLVILFDPSFNPDGLQRFSTWVNSHRGVNLVTDPASREFNEVWPGGRFNHYWFDLNRDWLPAVHPESQNRLQWYQAWKPNLLTDHHEQGSNATFFFQPGVPSRVNPLTPKENQQLTQRLANFHAAALDKIGSLYFTKEAYDDFYYGKGSTYPDANGGVGILFEQASSRGHAQQTANGVLRFPFTIRNQFITALSTLQGAQALRKDLLDYQRRFYRDALQGAAADPHKAYVIGSAEEGGRTRAFLEMLSRHGIAVHTLTGDLTEGGMCFRKGESFVVPAAQPQRLLIKSIFETQKDYADSLFYDITTWTMPLAYGIPHAYLRSIGASVMGDKVMPSIPSRGPRLSLSGIGYLMPWGDLYAPAALYELQSAGFQTRATTKPFTLAMRDGNRAFLPGSLLITPGTSDTARLLQNLQRIADRWSVPIYPVGSGAAVSGPDLGSGSFLNLTKPTVATIVGNGVAALDAGELWHLLDFRMGIAVSQLEPASFNRTDLTKYNTLVLAGGSYPDLNRDKLRTWVQGGGTLILMEDAIPWAISAGISTAVLRKAKGIADSTQRLIYGDRDEISGAQAVRGAILNADIDPTHPLAFGYKGKTVALFKGSNTFLEKSKSPFQTPFFYGASPVVSGWLSAQNRAAAANTAAVTVQGLGTGRIIHIADNPNFRGFWLGGSTLMMNALFFGRIIEGVTAE